MRGPIHMRYGQWQTGFTGHRSWPSAIGRRSLHRRGNARKLDEQHRWRRGSTLMVHYRSSGSQPGLRRLRRLMAGAARSAARAIAASPGQAQEISKYPDWSGQWKRPPGVGIQWDQTKRPGRTQQPPLTPEYQTIFEASLADQAQGGQGGNARVTCTTNGMPRIMSVIRPLEFVILPKLTYIIFEAYMPRRVYTDGRDFPTDEDPS